MGDEQPRWMRTDYTLTIYQNDDAGNAAIFDQAEMRDVIEAGLEAVTISGFQSFHVEQGNTTTEPTEEQEEMRRRCYRALADTPLNAPGPLLFEFAEDVLIACDEIEEVTDPDATHEIADGAVPVYTSDRIKLFTEDVGLAMWEPEIPSDGDKGVAEVAGLVLYDLATEIATAELRARQEREEEEV